MDKKFVKIAFVVAIAIVSGINVFNAQKSESLSDVVLANVEALAELEQTGNKAISDVLISVSYNPYSVTATYERSCAWGGRSQCSSGTYTITTLIN